METASSNYSVNSSIIEEKETSTTSTISSSNKSSIEEKKIVSDDPVSKEEEKKLEEKKMKPILFETKQIQTIVKEKSCFFTIDKQQPLSKLSFDPKGFERFLPNKDTYKNRGYLSQKQEQQKREGGGEQSLLPPKPCIETIRGISKQDKLLYSKNHGFFDTIMKAFTGHYDLALKPDHLWQAILEGFVKHIKQNSEQLRSKMVSFEGKKKIIIQRDSFVLGKKNNWTEVIEEIVEQHIRKEIPENLYNIIVGKPFSTTTSIEMIVRNLSLVAVTSSYFSLFCYTMCGIPSITLLGKKEDWIDLQNRIKSLEPFMLKEFATLWIPLLVEILDHCIGAFDGSVDQLFWQSICKFHADEGSGGRTYVSGWINNFYPYIDREGTKISPYLCNWKELQNRMGEAEAKYQTFQLLSEQDPFLNYSEYFYGRYPETFYVDYCSAPLTWNYLGQEIPMMLKGGFSGPCLMEEHTLTPKIAWALVRNEKEDSS